MNNLNKLITKGEIEPVTHTHTQNLFQKNFTNKSLELDDFLGELYIHIKFTILYVL